MPPCSVNLNALPIRLRRLLQPLPVGADGDRHVGLDVELQVEALLLGDGTERLVRYLRISWTGTSCA